MVIGRSLRRLEDRPLLTGQGRFAADIGFPGQLHMRVVRSPVAFGRLRAVEIDEARALPGVAAVWTGRDVATIPPIDFRQVRVPGLEPYRQPILAQDFVRYVGEPLAVVFAADPYLAEDAAELVFAEIEEMEPCLDATAEPEAFLPGVSSEAAIVEKAYGDLEGAFAAAHAIVELKLAVGRHSGVPLETRGAIARYDRARDVLELHGAAKIPHINRRAIAAMLGLPLARIHLYEGHVGGGFGIRGELYPEDVLVCLAALRLERPVKWIEDRREHLLAANHARDQVHEIRAAVDARGLILGIDDRFWTDQGAYVRTHAATVTDLTAAILPGPYLVPAYRSRGHIRLTNKTPCGTYRAPGRFEGTFVRERLIDAIAVRLGFDPLQVRRVNLIGPDAMPFARSVDALGTEVIYDSGDYPALLEHLLARIGHADLEQNLALRRSRGEKVGFGMGFFVEKSGLGPFDDALVLLEAEGGIEVVTGAASVGQGIETALAQICAEALGVRPEGIRVTHGRTDRIADGMGAFASRATVMTGSAVHLAATDLRHRLLEAAGRLLQTSPDDLTVEDGRIGRGGGDPSLGVPDLARELALQTDAGHPGAAHAHVDQSRAEEPAMSQPGVTSAGRAGASPAEAERPAAGPAEASRARSDADEHVAGASAAAGRAGRAQAETERPAGPGEASRTMPGADGHDATAPVAASGAGLAQGETERAAGLGEASRCSMSGVYGHVTAAPGTPWARAGQGGTERTAAGPGESSQRAMSDADAQVAAAPGAHRSGSAGAEPADAAPAAAAPTDAASSSGGQAGVPAAAGEAATRAAGDAGGGQTGASAQPSAVLRGTARFASTHMTYPYGIMAVVVRVDAATGGLAIERLWAAYDVGRAVNPMLIEAQIAGGAVQGIGGALLEEFVYDGSGQPLAASFADYLLPGLDDAPPMEVLLTQEAPSPLNPLGVKGAGEGGINAAGAAIAAAIDAALGRPGAVDRLPVSSERLYRHARGA